MTLLTVENISKSYGMKVLFEHISFSIQEEDKIGLIGINGTGKSTLLKILSGQEVKDDGLISYAKGLRISYLPQNPEYETSSTVFEQVFSGNTEEMNILRDYENTLRLLETHPDHEAGKKDLLRLTGMMQAKNLWDIESQVKTILTRLGITQFDALMGTLSGGQKKRVALATALITPSDLLILDEPTNHMDNDTIDWLEKFLLNRRGAVLMITHDRYFLDRVVNRTLELDFGQLYIYTGNYSQFIEKKLERQSLANSLERKRQNLYRRELEWIRTGARARTTKQKARIQRFEQLEDTTYLNDEGKISVSVAYTRLGQKIIEVQNLSKGFDRLLIQNFSYIVLREDRIGIIGDNGVGKSTLLNMICGRLQPDDGIVDIGQTVKIGYFSQEAVEMDLSLRAIDYIKEVAEYVTTADGMKISASQLMENFLFTGDMQWTPIERLSGGERRRLYLLRILISEPNVLILDEPTNDLDIDTLKVLENYIDDFSGAVMTVSHDRYFLDRICNKIFAFTGETTVEKHTGNYSDYQEFQKNRDVQTLKTRDADKKHIHKPENERPKKPSMTFKEKIEFEKIDQEILELEDVLTAIESDLTQNTSDFVLLQTLTEKKEATEERLLEKMERQEFLYALDAEIKAFKNV